MGPCVRRDDGGDGLAPECRVQKARYAVGRPARRRRCSYACAAPRHAHASPAFARKVTAV